MAEEMGRELAVPLFLCLAGTVAGPRGQGELRQPQDTCHLPRRLHPTYLARVFQAQWQEGARLWRTLYGAFGHCYLALGLLKLVGTMLGFSGPLLLSLLVGFLEEGQEPLNHGLLYALGRTGGPFWEPCCRISMGMKFGGSSGTGVCAEHPVPKGFTAEAQTPSCRGGPELTRHRLRRLLQLC